MSEKTKNIYQRLLAVVKASGAIAKTGKAHATMGGFGFHKIDEVVDHLRPLLLEHGVLPLVSALDCSTRDVEVMRRDNPAIDHAALCQLSVTFVNVDNPEDATPPLVSFGEGLDTSDKATGKAISYALKNLLLSQFQLRGQPDNEGEHASERRPPGRRQQGTAPRPTNPPGNPPTSGPAPNRQLALMCWKHVERGGGEERKKAWAAILQSYERLAAKGGVKPISEPQKKRLFAGGNEAGWTPDHLRDEYHLQTSNSSMTDMPWQLYEAVTVMFGARPVGDDIAWPRPEQPEPQEPPAADDDIPF